MPPLIVELVQRHASSEARILKINTPHGTFLTPTFMPVGTRAGVNNLSPQELKLSKSQIILGGNTYHMLCSPGMKIIEKAGGMHPFMGWDGPMLTDSGGFQVFSLSKNSDICDIKEDGAYFKSSHQDHFFKMTPEISLRAQKIIGADIIMCFDQCTPDNAPLKEARVMMQRTHRWLQESVEYHQKYPKSFYGNEQALFAIIQGGAFKELRLESAEFVYHLNTDGIAIGGESIGFNMPLTLKIIRWLQPILLQTTKPLYTMGVGMSPQDLLDVIACGIDMFDCVAPTRNARHGALYCGEIQNTQNWLKFVSSYPNQRLQIKKECFAQDQNPIMPSCDCYTCQHYSRAFLHYLFKRKAILFTTLACIHNVHVMNTVCAQARSLIFRSRP